MFSGMILKMLTTDRGIILMLLFVQFPITVTERIIVGRATDSRTLSNEEFPECLCPGIDI